MSLLRSRHGAATTEPRRRLSDVVLSPAAVIALRENLPVGGGLETVRLDFVQPSCEEEGPAVRSELCKFACGLAIKNLSLRGNKLGDSDAAALQGALERESSLCGLNLYGNKLTDAGACCVVRSLRLNRSLQGISLSQNEIRLDQDLCEPCFCDQLPLDPVRRAEEIVAATSCFEVPASEVAARKQLEKQVTAARRAEIEALKKRLPKGAALPKLVELEPCFQRESKTRAWGSKLLSLLDLTCNPVAGSHAETLAARVIAASSAGDSELRTLSLAVDPSRCEVRTNGRVRVSL